MVDPALGPLPLDPIKDDTHHKELEVLNLEFSYTPKKKELNLIIAFGAVSCHESIQRKRRGGSGTQEIYRAVRCVTIYDLNSVYLFIHILTSTTYLGLV